MLSQSVAATPVRQSTDSFVCSAMAGSVAVVVVAAFFLRFGFGGSGGGGGCFVVWFGFEMGV
jgi:hypothetical protein